MPTSTPELDWIGSQHARLVELVTCWAALNSHSHNLPGLAALTAVVCDAFATLGAELREIDLPPWERIDDAGRINLVPAARALHLRKRPDAPRRVLLNIHLDTVYPPESPFQQVERLDANTLRGPGVADAKGGLAVMLAALEAFERSPLAPQLGWEVLLNPDEEIGSPASAGLLAECARRNHVGLLFEPALDSTGALACARRGSGNFTLVVHGRAAHAGRDLSAGRNAIAALAPLVTAIQELNDPAGGVTANVGRITGGTAPNVVPDLALARLNLRVEQPVQQAALEARLADLVAQVNRRDGFRAELHGRFHCPPKPLDAPTQVMLDDLAACARELGQELTWRLSGGASDGNKLAAAGLPTVDSLGPIGGEIHSPQEYLRLDSLVPRARLVALYLLRLAAGEARLPP